MKTFGFICLGFFIACALGAASGLVARAAKGEVDLTPTEVMVAASDVSEGVALADEHMRLFTVPAAYVTESMVRATDWPRLTGRSVTTPLESGDALTWQHFARTDRVDAVADCVQTLHPGVEAAADERMTSELAAMTFAELETSAPAVTPRGKTVRVIAAASDLPENSELTATSLRVVDVPVFMFTESLIAERDLGAVSGAKVVTSLLAGDLLTWPALRRDEVVGANTCIARLTDASHEAKVAFVKQAVATFELGEAP